jgi:hypothetical protein
MVDAPPRRGVKKLRYLMGVATAVNLDGKTVRVMLDEIHLRARDG